MKKHKTTLIIIFLVIGLGGLFALPRFTDPSRKEVARWKGEADVRCLVQPHAAATTALHVHPRLVIRVDGEEEEVPANIGITPNCTAELHTHEMNDPIHTESFTPGKTFTLGQFFTVWNKSIEREGYELKATVGGEENEEIEKLVLEDGQEIVFEYVSKEFAEQKTSTSTKGE